MSGANGALLTTLFRTASTRARVLGFSAVALVTILISIPVRSAVQRDGLDPAVTMVDSFGLSLVVPLCALVFGTAVLGDPIEDRTYVYLWLRPIRRWLITLWGFVVTVGLVVAFGVVPTVFAAAIATGEGNFIGGTALGALGAAVAYSAFFVLLGHLTRRSLVWGIAYLLIYELFIARGGRGVGVLSIRAYATSLFESLSEVTLRLGYFSGSTAVIGIVVVSGIALGISAMRQESMSVD